ncbi:MAG: uracil-DNA glycosylase [Sinobacteraceae bacterium]|nr:uracil-DNA glycosylase [Nevskiaceae bacterium]
MLERARRSQYLQALGIDEWTRRVQPAVDIVETVSGEDEWTVLQNSVAACQRCALHECRTQTVFGVGDRRAEWMVVGEAPGAEEDARGEPFVGAAGQLLNAMLAAIGLARESVFIANVLKCRPPGNRDPSPAEIAECLPYLHQQIRQVKPRLILAFGRVAAQSLLGTDQPLGALRGSVHAAAPLNTPVVVTYHPAYLLRTPAEKRKAWEDLKYARRIHAELR